MHPQKETRQLIDDCCVAQVLATLYDELAEQSAPTPMRYLLTGVSLVLQIKPCKRCSRPARP
jgi:hypothetical protein